MRTKGDHRRRVAAKLRQCEDEDMAETDLRGHAGNRRRLLRRVPDPRHFHSGRTWDQLRSNVREAVRAAFTIRRKLIRVISVRDMNRNEASAYERMESEII